MGADGGTIPKRCELVRNKKKQEKIAKEVTAATKWKTCQLTQLPLREPIVACKLGRLYNKEAILEAKLDKSLSQNEATKHIKALSDVKQLRLTKNRAFKGEGADKGDVYVDVNETQFICPITTLGMNGTYSFLVNWDCGCVFSERAITEAKSDTCYGCGESMNPNHLLTLYPGDELLKVYQERIAKEQSLRKTAKKQGGAEVAAKCIDNQAPSTSAASSRSQIKRKVEGKHEEATKRKAEASTSIQSDPKASKVLKSIFTSSEDAKKQPTGHWVTYNPLYY